MELTNGCWTLFSSLAKDKYGLWRAISPRDNEYIVTTDTAEIRELAALLEAFLQELGPEMDSTGARDSR